MPTGAALEAVDDGAEDAVVHLVEAAAVNLHAVEGLAADGGVEGSVAHHLRVVADALEEAVGDAGRAAGTGGDFRDGVGIGGELENSRRARHDLLDGLRRVEVEAVDRAEAVPERGAHHGVAGGGADEGEGGDLEPDTARRRPLADHDVEGEVFEGGVEDFLDATAEAVNLVDEEDVVLLEVGEDGGHVAGALDGGAGGDADVHPHLGRDDVGERGLAESGRPVEEDVVERLLALLRGEDADAEVVLDLLLPDVLLERAGAQARLGGGVFRPAFG